MRPFEMRWEVGVGVIAVGVVAVAVVAIGVLAVDVCGKATASAV